MYIPLLLVDMLEVLLSLNLEGSYEKFPFFQLPSKAKVVLHEGSKTGEVKTQGFV